jgi:GGDEF domain-containing protein
LNPAFEATLTFAPQPAHTDANRRPQFPSWLRMLARPWQSLPVHLHDRSTGLYNRAGLLGAANEILGHGSSRQGFSMVVLDFPDLREVWEIYGSVVGQKVVSRLVRRLRLLAGWHGLAGRTGPAQFTVILPGVPQQRAQRQVGRVLGRPARIEFDAGDSEIVLVPDYLVDSAERAATQVQELYRDMCREVARMQKDERLRLHYLASERERHSRPMALPILR